MFVICPFAAASALAIAASHHEVSCSDVHDKSANAVTIKRSAENTWPILLAVLPYDYVGSQLLWGLLLEIGN